MLGAQSSESKTQDKNYAEIYRRIGEIVENSNYSTNRIIAKAKQCKVKKKLISFDYSCKFGVRINKFHKNYSNLLIFVYGYAKLYSSSRYAFSISVMKHID